MTTTKTPAEAGEQEQQTKPTADEVLESLTGFDEIAIEQAFGSDITSLARVSVGKFGRALAFVLARRDGMSDKDAKARTLGLTRREVDDLFAEDDDQLPGSEAGKGGS